jgi:hypothetical protein
MSFPSIQGEVKCQSGGGGMQLYCYNQGNLQVYNFDTDTYWPYWNSPPLGGGVQGEMRGVHQYDTVTHALVGYHIGIADAAGYFKGQWFVDYNAAFFTARAGARYELAILYAGSPPAYYPAVCQGGTTWMALQLA